MTLNYALKSTGPHSKAMNKDLPISPKQSEEVCRWIRDLHVEAAKKKLNSVINDGRPVPYTRHNWDIGHRKGMAAGRYPVKTCTKILSIIESAEKNAQQKGLGKDLKLRILCHKGGNTNRYGRQSRIIAKRTTIEVVLEEMKKEDIKQKKERKNKKEAAKPEAKK